jgi:hypothetical protein
MKLKRFNPLTPCQSDYEFIVTDPRKVDDGLRRLKAKIEADMCAFVPAKYRRYVRLFATIRKPPAKSVAGWEYKPV